MSQRHELHRTADQDPTGPKSSRGLGTWKARAWCPLCDWRWEQAGYENRQEASAAATDAAREHGEN